jgi:hypothetical protein
MIENFIGSASPCVIADPKALRIHTHHRFGLGEGKVTELQMLMDERQIIRGLGRFARILDTKNWKALPEVFAGDLTFDYGAGGEQHGIEALADQMRRFLDVCGPTWMYAAPPSTSSGALWSM